MKSKENKDKNAKQTAPEEEAVAESAAENASAEDVIDRENMSDEEAIFAYEHLLWVKAIVVNIDLP